MPKRRAKTKLPPLAFEESPVHIVNNPPDPVFASDNPPTADVVLLDHDISFPWVSPQFHGQPTPGPSRRRCRTQCSTLSTTTRSRHLSGRANHTVNGRLTRSQHPHLQFPALQFIGEPIAIQSPPSPCDEISMNDPDPVKCRKIVGKIAVHDGDTPIAAQHNTPDLQGEDPQRQQSDSDHDESPSIRPRRVKASTARRKMGKFKKKKGRLKDLAAQLDFTPEADPGDYAHCEQQLDIIRENDSDMVINPDNDKIGSKTLSKNDKTESNAMSPCLTQLRPMTKQKPERKRLFGLKHVDNHDSTSDGEQYMNEFDLIKPRSLRCTGKDNRNFRSEDSVVCNSTPLCNTTKSNGDLNASTPDKPRNSSRLMEIRRGMFSSLLSMTPTQRSENDYNVLVYDTPEEDYGLTHRQRRLRLLKHQRRKIQSKQ